MPPRILCHIHTFNDDEVISHCVESVLRQTRPVDKFLIVDNASIDGTLDREFPPGTEIIRNDTNLGTSGAIEVGLRYAVDNKFDWLWVLDADATPGPDALQELMSVWENLPNHDQESTWRLACLPMEAPEKAVNMRSKAAELLTYAGDEGLKARHGIIIGDRGCHQFDPEIDAAQLQHGAYYEFDYTIWSGCLFRVEFVAKVGLPNIDYVLDYGEYEYSYRGKLAGLKGIMCVNSVIEQNITGHATYRFTPYSILGLQFQLVEMAPFRCYYLCRNLINFWVYEYQGNRLIAATPRVLKLLLFTLNFAVRPVSRRPEAIACIRGIWDGFRRNMGKRYMVFGRKRAGAVR